MGNERNGTTVPFAGGGPDRYIHSEKPEHVLICYMIAAGKSKQEVATQTGMSYSAVNQISKQPWFRTRYLAIIKEAGMDAVEAFVKGESIASLEVLREVRDNLEEKGATRITAANSLLDRALGKPTVHVESESNLTVESAASTKEDIERQIATISKELQDRGQSATIPNRN